MKTETDYGQIIYEILMNRFSSLAGSQRFDVSDVGYGQSHETQLFLGFLPVP